MGGIHSLVYSSPTFLLLSSVIFSAFCANKQGVLVWNIELAYHEEKDSSTSLATAKL